MCVVKKYFIRLCTYIYNKEDTNLQYMYLLSSNIKYNWTIKCA